MLFKTVHLQLIMTGSQCNTKPLKTQRLNDHKSANYKLTDASSIIEGLRLRIYGTPWDSLSHRLTLVIDPVLIRSVPVAWRADFAAESKEAESKMADLKSRILSSGAKVMER